jgi:hypothetical protein
MEPDAWECTATLRGVFAVRSPSLRRHLSILEFLRMLAIRRNAVAAGRASR